MPIASSAMPSVQHPHGAEPLGERRAHAGRGERAHGERQQDHARLESVVAARRLEEQRDREEEPELPRLTISATELLRLPKVRMRNRLRLRTTTLPAARRRFSRTSRARMASTPTTAENRTTEIVSLGHVQPAHAELRDRGHPAVAVALDEREHDAEQADGDEDGAGEVHALGAAALLGLGDGHEDADEHDDADRDVDEEGPVPGRVGREPSADQRAESGGAADGAAPDGERDGARTADEDRVDHRTASSAGSSRRRCPAGRERR